MAVQGWKTSFWKQSVQSFIDKKYINRWGSQGCCHMLIRWLPFHIWRWGSRSDSSYQSWVLYWRVFHFEISLLSYFDSLQGTVPILLFFEWDKVRVNSNVSLWEPFGSTLRLHFTDSPDKDGKSACVPENTRIINRIEIISGDRWKWIYSCCSSKLNFGFEWISALDLEKALWIENG